MCIRLKFKLQTLRSIAVKSFAKTTQVINLKADITRKKKPIVEPDKLEYFIKSEEHFLS